MRRATIFAQAATSFFAQVCVVLMKFAGGAVAGSRAMARGNPWQACNQAAPRKAVRAHDSWRFDRGHARRPDRTYDPCCRDARIATWFMLPFDRRWTVQTTLPKKLP